MASLPLIRRNGIQRGKRHHVHLSHDRETAWSVACRRGEPVMLTIGAGQMHRDGQVFYRSVNGVWLVDYVPVKYVQPNSFG